MWGLLLLKVLSSEQKIILDQVVRILSCLLWLNETQVGRGVQELALGQCKQYRCHRMTMEGQDSKVTFYPFPRPRVLEGGTLGETT